MKVLCCEVCNKSFEAKRSDKKCCSESCYNKRRWGKSKCVRCEKDYWKTGKNTLYCSIECSKLHYWEQKDLLEGVKGVYSDKSAQTRIFIYNCFACGKESSKRAGDYKRSLDKNKGVFCSIQCANIFTKRTMLLKCSQCDKQFTRARAEYEKYNKNGKYTFCSRSCQDKNLDYIKRFVKEMDINVWIVVSHQKN
jgi:hypothetical protein